PARVPSQRRVPMSRWITALASIAQLAFSLPAIAADNDLPRNIELKPGAAPAEGANQAAEDASSGVTTRQIVTEGKEASAAGAPRPRRPQAPPPPAGTSGGPEKTENAPPAPAPDKAEAPSQSLQRKPQFPPRRRLRGSSRKKWSSRWRRN